jgi:hypothetical protein
MVPAWLARVLQGRKDVTEVSPVAKPAATVPTGELSESRTAIRDTTKWLVAGAGAVAAVIVAGLQLSSLPASALGRILGLGGFGLALAGVGLVVFKAADVLATGYTHLGELADLQVAAATEAEGGPPTVTPLGHLQLAEFVASMQTELRVLSRGEAEDVSTLYGSLMDSYDAVRGLRTEREVRTPGGHRYTRADVPRLSRTISALEAAAQQLITFSNQRVAEASFRTLRRAVVQGGVALAIGVGLFALGTTLGDPLPVAEPTPVLISPTDPTLFGEACDETVLEGVAVGGTWEAPLVAIAPTSGCSSRQLEIGPDTGVVIPSQAETDDRSMDQA